MKKSISKLLFLATVAVLTTVFCTTESNAQTFAAGEGAFTVIGTGGSPSVITGADTVYLKATITGSGSVTITNTLVAGGTSPTISGTIALFVSLDGVNYFAHPVSADASITLSTQAPSSVPPSTGTGTYLSIYTRYWTWPSISTTTATTTTIKEPQSPNPFKYYMIRIICTAVGGTSPTFTCSARYRVNRISGYQ
jgi:hypothetical protein